MKVAVEKIQSEYLKITQEKEQQESLVLEELELKKKAILIESENKLQDLQQEAETYRTRILELESSLAKSLQENKNQSEDLAVHKHNKEITIMTEKHKAELESLQHQQDNLWTERVQILKQQHQTEMEKFREKCEQEKETLLKEKDSLFQAHIEEMNEKTLGKLDVKQTELESLSFELSEVVKSCNKLEEELSVLRNQADKMKQELETRLVDKKNQHQQQVERIIKEQEISIQRNEKALKDQINELGLLLKEKEKHLEKQQAHVEKLEAEIERSEGEFHQASAKLDLIQSHQSTTHDQAKAYEEQLAQLQQKLLDLEKEKVLLTNQLENTVLELSQKEKQFNAKILEVTQANSAGISDAVSRLETNQEKIENLTEVHQQELNDVVSSWEKKFNQQAEELQEKYEIQFQKKEQEIAELMQKIHICRCEKEEMNKEIMWLKEEGVKQDATLNELQEQLKQKSVLMTSLSQNETKLRVQLEKLEVELNHSLKENTSFQEQLVELKMLAEKGKFKVSELTDNLKTKEEEFQSVESFRQATHQLEEKENQIKSRKAEIEGLVTEKEALQKEGGNQQQVASEKESCIIQLKKELSENINAVTLMKEELTEKKSEIVILRKQLTDLNAQLQNSISLIEKEAAISSLSSMIINNMNYRISYLEAQHNDLEFKLARTEQEKRKLSKEIVRLQKYLQMLRKDHHQELDILKKECEQDMKEKIKQDQKDLELKHNATLKQLMREFDTQLAQKEQELKKTIKETISKAQEVEADLLESHQEEISQLCKKIAEKDDDQKRTAKRYEEILDAHEEEMTAKVMDLQTQIEELQKKCQEMLQQEENAGNDNATIMVLQTQLAQKMTVISDSKLKEQEFKEFKVLQFRRPFKEI
ncbi:Golgin subfamily A member 4 [Heterocephalus glaber]|uniref:Golgin subfamily A member 4 n=1 Tax=Heterocephalus glaber TaxID=10181 RepID=G5AZW1_HETGA|nr:Golgin subfamily A member 4 [Heterocephalus glaber]